MSDNAKFNPKVNETIEETHAVTFWLYWRLAYLVTPREGSGQDIPREDIPPPLEAPGEDPRQGGLPPSLRHAASWPPYTGHKLPHADRSSATAYDVGKSIKERPQTLSPNHRVGPAPVGRAVHGADVAATRSHSYSSRVRPVSWRAMTNRYQHIVWV